MILVGYPIFAGITTSLGVESNSLSILYRLIVLLAASVLLLTSLLDHRLQVNYQLLIGANFLFYYTLRMLSEWLLNSNDSKLDWTDFWSFLILVCLVPALPFAWKRNLPNAYYTPICIIIFGIIGLTLNFGIGFLSAGDQLLSGRLESERLNPIAYGHLGVSTALMSLWVILIRREISILAISGVVVGVIGVVASGSRGPVLSLVVCFTLIVFQLKFRSVIFIAMFSVIFMAGSLLFSTTIDFDDIYILNRIGTSMFEDDSRIGILRASYHAFIENFFFGAGYPFDSYPHNIIIEAFMSSGVMGGILMIATLTSGAIASFYLLKNEIFSWIGLLFIQYLLFSLVSNSIYYSNILWLLWVCVVTLGANRNFTEARRNADVRIKHIDEKTETVID